MARGPSRRVRSRRPNRTGLRTKNPNPGSPIRTESGRRCRGPGYKGEPNPAPDARETNRIRFLRPRNEPNSNSNLGFGIESEPEPRQTRDRCDEPLQTETADIQCLFSDTVTPTFERTSCTAVSDNWTGATHVLSDRREPCPRVSICHTPPILSILSSRSIPPYCGCRGRVGHKGNWSIGVGYSYICSKAYTALSSP